MATHEDILSYIEHFIDQRRKRIQVMEEDIAARQAIRDKLVAEQPHLETAWTVMLGELETRQQVVTQLTQPVNGQAPDSNSRMYGKIARLMESVGPMTAEQVQQALITQHGLYKGLQSIISTMSHFNKIFVRVAPKTYDLVRRSSHVTIDRPQMEG